MSPRPGGVERLLDGREICVCAGSGGVGKTTTSAAVALGMAAAGRKVAVLTIDPARRLASSLGLEELGNEPRRIDPERFSAHGLELRGELWAMMLDPKRTFDEVVERYAPDAAARDRILSNRIYQELSNAVAGSQEYMAMEKLYELHQQADYDLLVLDTPPTRNALDFLEAPERLSRFLGSRALGMFLKPGRTGFRVLGRGTAVVFGLLKRITGVDLLQDLSEFFQSIGGMAEGVRQRAERVRELLADPRTSFLVVTSPQADAIDEALFFRGRLADAGMPFGGAVVNRVHQAVPEDAGDLEAELGGLLYEDLARKVARNLEDYRRLADRDRHSVARLEHELGGAPVIRVPLLEEDVHDVRGLLEMNRHLFPEDPPAEPRPAGARRARAGGASGEAGPAPPRRAQTGAE